MPNIMQSSNGIVIIQCNVVNDPVEIYQPHSTLLPKTLHRPLRHLSIPLHLGRPQRIRPSCHSVVVTAVPRLLKQVDNAQAAVEGDVV